MWQKLVGLGSLVVLFGCDTIQNLRLIAQGVFGLTSDGWVSVASIVKPLIFPLVVVGCVGFVGCANQMDPIQNGVQTTMKEVVGPAVQKGLGELATRTGQMQAGGQLINPGYKCKGSVSFGPTAAWEVSVETMGVAGQLQIAGQGDQGPDLKRPFDNSTTTSKPAEVEISGQ